MQLDLIHGDIWSALRSLVDNCGGSKVVGPMLWPAKGIEGSAKWLDDCLNPERSAKLCLEEFCHLLRIGRERGWHHAKHFLDDVTFYDRTPPANPTIRKEAAEARGVDLVAALQSCIAEINDCKAMEQAEQRAQLRSVR